MLFLLVLILLARLGPILAKKVLSASQISAPLFTTIVNSAFPIVERVICIFCVFPRLY